MFRESFLDFGIKRCGQMWSVIIAANCLLFQASLRRHGQKTDGRVVLLFFQASGNLTPAAEMLLALSTPTLSPYI